MKKILFLLLLLPLLGGGFLSAQTVSGLKVETVVGSPSTVTFDVSWDEDALPALWSDTMWVFVDYNKNVKMTRLPLLLLSGATLTATSAPGVGKLIEENVKGAWVVGDARTNSPFSATVQLFTDETTIAGACAYASSYPPMGKYVSASEIVFTGTPMYEITLVHENGNTFETIESGGTFLLPCTYTVSSFTDATGAPGIIKCIEPTGLSLTASPETICAGESATLTASATGAVSYSLDGTNWQPETDFNETPLSTTAYTLYAQTEAGCSVSVANAVAVAVGQPGADGEPSTCGCATGTTECGGICKDTGTYTTNDGDCAGCHIAYVQQRDQCDAVINAKYSTYSSTCTTPNQVTNDGACTINCHYAFQRLKDACGNVIQAQHGTYYTASTCASSTCEPQWGCNPTCWDNMISVWEGVYDGQCKDVCIKASLGWTCTSGGHNSLNDSCYCYRCN